MLWRLPDPGDLTLARAEKRIAALDPAQLRSLMKVPGKELAPAVEAAGIALGTGMLGGDSPAPLPAWSRGRPYLLRPSWRILARLSSTAMASVSLPSVTRKM